MMGFFLFGWLFMILIWVLIFAGIGLVVRWLLGYGESPGNKSVALDILRTRYAKGEINKKEFEDKKRDLGR